MINIDLRKESPQDNVNRILAVESLVKYYPLSVIEKVDKRCLQYWSEVDENNKDIPMKQIDMGFILFGLPTPELRYLMKKLEDYVLANQIVPQENDPISTDSIPEVKKLSNRERLELEFKEKQMEAIKNRTLIDNTNKGEQLKDQPKEVGTEIAEAKVIQTSQNLNL